MPEIDYEDILNEVREKGNMGGIWTEVYAARRADVDTFASKPSESGNRSMTGMNKLSVGADTLLPGKRLFKIYTTQEKGSLNAEGQGEVDGVSKKGVLTLFNPGLTEEGLSLMEIPNQDWIFWIRTGEQMYRLGTEAFPAKLAPDGAINTGAATADLKGVAMSFFSYEVGFPGQVIDIDAILAMVSASSLTLTAAFVPLLDAGNVLVSATPTITFSEAVVSADTLIALTNPQLAAAITVKTYDISGNFIADIAFTAAIVGEVATITPDASMGSGVIHEVKFDRTKILAATGNGTATGANSTRFTTA